MTASIEGVLIKPASDMPYGFILTPEFWGWMFREFPSFAGKQVRITIATEEPENER